MSGFKFQGFGVRFPLCSSDLLSPGEECIHREKEPHESQGAAFIESLHTQVGGNIREPRGTGTKAK